MSTRLRWLVLTLLLLLSRNALAQWEVIDSLPVRGSAAYFFNANEGVIGTGEYLLAFTARIYYTTNGGSTWIPSVMPNYVQGQITDVWFKDRKNGWATLAEVSNTGWSGVYRSSDGGKSWKLVKQSQFPVGVRENSVGIYFTDRGAANSGVYRSVDNGKTFSLLVANPAPLGIDFLDNQFGYITSEATPGAPHLYTSDGGNTWGALDTRKEAWGIYCDPASRAFVYASEKNANPPYSNSGLERSTDLGRSFTRRWDGNQNAITGGISGWRGCRTVMYAQGQGPDGGPNAMVGLLRSTDGGVTWVSVGGPSNVRDTRFAVTGRGAVVYAFDAKGRVWKTINGGDGKLTLSIRDQLSIVRRETWPIATRLCDSVDFAFTLNSSSCDSVRIVDVESVEDPYNEIRSLFDTSQSKPFIGTMSETILGRFRPNEIGQRMIFFKVTIRHADGYLEDTLISLPINAQAPADRYVVTGLTGNKTLHFGDVDICTGDSSRVIEIQNLGCAELRLQDLSVGPSAFEIRSRVSPIVLDPDDSRKYLLRFKPTTQGAHTAKLIVTTAQGRDTITLTGSGVPGQRGMLLSQEALISSLCDSAEATVTLRNRSCGNLTIEGLGLAAPLYVTDFTPGTLAPDATLTIRVRFVPTQPGAIALPLTILAKIGSEDFDTTLILEATASEGKAALSIIDNLFFDSVSTCSERVLGLVLRSIGCDTLEIDETAIDDPNASFTIDKPFSDLSLLRGEDDTIWIRFKPEDEKEYRARLRIRTNGGDRLIDLIAYGKNDDGSLTFAITADAVADLCDDDDLLIQLANTTCDDVVIDSIRVGGQDAQDFAFASTDRTPLVVGANLNVPGIFTPSEAGPRRAIVTIYITGPDGQTTRQFDLTGLGNNIPPMTMSIPIDTTMEGMLLEEVYMPIYTGLASQAPIRAIEFALSLNTDLLTPVELILAGTEMEGGTVADFSVSKFDSMRVRVEFTPARMLKPGILAKLRFQSFVADTLFTYITPIRFSVEAENNKCISSTILSAERRGSFRLIPECGDQTLSEHLRGTIPGMKIEMIRPNPTRGNVKIGLEAPADLQQTDVEVFDMTAKLVARYTLPVTRTKGKASISLVMPASSGVYYVRVRSLYAASTRRVVVTR